MFTRRQWLLGGAALGAGLAMPRVVRAEVAPRDRKFLFVFARGGWDPTKVFCPVFSPHIDREAGEEAVTVGGLSLVASSRRPVTAGFFANNHGKIAKLDGMLIRSINHPICRNLWLTNRPNADSPDWPAIIGHAAADRFVVPHMIVEGYSMAGDLAAFTAVSGNSGQLEDLLGPTSMIGADDPKLPLSVEAEALVDDWIASRAAAKDELASTDAEAKLTFAFRESATRLPQFKAETAPLDLSGENVFLNQIDQAVQFLSGGVSRCVSVTLPTIWDTHRDNSPQSSNFEELFFYLGVLNQELAAASGTVAATLAEETVVVVFSEMGRTPFLNSTGGKDHWMYTSSMLWGPGVRGDFEAGGFDDKLNGLYIDIPTGQPNPKGAPLTPDVLGSTLLTLAGIDPASVLGADTTLRDLIV